MSQHEHRRRILPGVRRLVVKVGSSLLSTPKGLDQERIATLVAEVEALWASGRQVILVTSGAVAAGMTRLGLRDRPKTIPQKQAAAAVGQIDLMAFYEECFARHGRNVGQMLLTRDDLTNRRRYLNAKHTLNELLGAGVIPIVNENDTVVVEEIKLGDNDRLSAAVAALAEADLLVILSDVDALYTADPRREKAASPIAVVDADDRMAQAAAGSSSGPFGTGGMITKVEAARKAAAAGIPTLVADGRRADVLRSALDTEADFGTLVIPATDRLTSRKHWIAHTLVARGALRLDEGAVAALRERKRSLLPSGIRSVEGEFGAGDCVRCVSPAGDEIARGLVNYAAVELRKILGSHSRDIEAILGYKVSDAAIHRDDLVVL